MQGITVKTQSGEESSIYADYTILASGGISGCTSIPPNFPHLTGDALEVAKKHHIRLEHLDYVQIHPTTLYSEKPGRRFDLQIRPWGRRFSIIKTRSVRR